MSHGSLGESVLRDPNSDPIGIFSSLFERFKVLPRALEAANEPSRDWHKRDLLEKIIKLEVPQEHKDTVIAIIGASGTGKFKSRQLDTE